MTHLYSKEAVIRYTLRIDLAFCFMKPAFYVKEFEPDFQKVWRFVSMYLKVSIQKNDGIWPAYLYN